MHHRSRIALLLVTLAAMSSSAFAADALAMERTSFKPVSGSPVEAEIGTLVVPENRRTPTGHTITLRFVRFRSTSEHPGAPIVYLAGGPGGSGIDAAKGARFPLFMALREFGDVIALDQRGTGGSLPSTRCTESYELSFTKPLERGEASAAFAAGMKKCINRLAAEGIDANSYNTLESADDLNDLRKALAVEKISLWGISYGTHLALATLRAHGEHIDRAILAGIEPLADTLKLPRDQQVLLKTIAGLAKADHRFAKVMPDLTGTIAKILRRLHDKPATVNLVHPATGQSVPMQVGAFDLQVVLAAMLTGPDSFAGMPDFVARLASSDDTALALQAARFRSGKLDSMMSVAMDCASGVSRELQARIEREATQTVLGDAINLPFPEICSGLGIADLGDAFRRAPESKLPMLLISGTLDGRTPAHNATDLLPQFPNAQNLLIEGAGHSDPLFLSSPRILEAMQTFMRGGKLHQRTIAGPRVEFIAPRRPIDVAASTLDRTVGRYRIDAGGERTVIKAGNLLFSIRSGGAPYALRPTSDTEFFWEGLPGRVQVDLAPDGKVRALVIDQDGTGRTLERSEKID